MHSNTIKLVIIGLIGLSTASPTPRNTDPYATFYDDDACTQNQGEPVDVTNPGCLNESGRNSIYFQSAFDFLPYSLVYSPSQDCPCQNYCIDYINPSSDMGSYCYSIAGTPAAESYRFIEGACASNNC